MQLVERHIIVGSSELTELCSKSKRLYNQSLYYLRQYLFKKVQYFSEYELTGLLAEFNDVNYRALPAMCSQQIIKLLFKNWKSFWKSMEAYDKNPSKFMAKPKPPSYKKEQFVTVFTNQQVKIKDGHICFTKTILSPLKTNVTNICQVRIIPQASCHVIEVVYEKEITDLKLHPSRVLSLDLGISNFATSINNAGLTPFIVNGKPIKAFNQWYNKCKAELQSNLKGKRFSSRRIEKITHYRNCWINDKMHKISRFIVDYCIKKDIGTIVIGKNKNWKQQVNIGAKNNQQFTNIPHVKLIEKIRYKAEMVGIKFVETEESYTSKCDALVLEPIQKHDCYKGKRIKRGLFVSSNGKLINADINGAINIARKVIGDDFVKSLLNSGIGQMPYRINIL